MIKPNCLKVGDTVGIIAPSDAVDREDMQKSIEIIRSWGLKIKMGKHVYSSVGDFMAGTAEERIDDLKFMVEEPEMKAVWCAAGGYAATEILPAFDKSMIQTLKQNPKIFIGYSDVCMILNALTSFRIVNVMGPTVWGLYEWDEESRETMRKLLMGEPVSGIGSEKTWHPEVEGVATGKIVASNLECLIFSFGTRFDPLMYGVGPVILVLEELDIEKSTLQRQIDVILEHKRADRIAAVVVGRLTNIRELSYPEWGRDVTAQGLVASRLKKWGKNKIPVAFCEDFGHAEWDYEDLAEDVKSRANRKFLGIPNGIEAKLEVAKEGCSLQYLESICQ